MAQNVTLLGASYPDVPMVLLPKTGGGTAAFTDVSDTTATASDVAAGVVFYAADGTRTVGTLNVLNTFFPVGTVITNMSSTAPSFGGTWREVIITQTNAQLKSGEMGFKAGTSSGPVHHWQRTA